MRPRIEGKRVIDMSVRFSVAMAVYNAGKYLAEQVESILGQIGTGDELIISCDPSTDGSTEAARRIAEADSRVTVVENDRPGIAGNFNNAIHHCSGSIIFISDQDDRWVDHKVSTVAKAFEDPAIGMVIHNGYDTDENLNIIGKDFFSTDRIGPSLILNFFKPRYSGCCMAFRKELTEWILPIPARIDAYDHWIGMVGELRSKIRFIPEPLILHRLHSENVTPRKTRAFGRVIAARSRLLRELIRRKRKRGPL